VNFHNPFQDQPEYDDDEEEERQKMEPKHPWFSVSLLAIILSAGLVLWCLLNSQNIMPEQAHGPHASDAVSDGI
jgi:quinol-cytochrome oxidoreductase complex cytochrome b subunit